MMADDDERTYSTDQVDAIVAAKVAAERERCAGSCEQLASGMTNKPVAEALRTVAELLRLTGPNVRANRPATAAGVWLVCEGAEGAAHEAYAGCRSGSG